MTKMTNTALEIINAIESRVEARGGDWWQWYVGVAADAENRLFSDHNVCRVGDAWIYSTAPTSQVAREVEAYLLKTHGAQGGTGGGDDDTRTVYAYRTADHTLDE